MSIPSIASALFLILVLLPLDSAICQNASAPSRMIEQFGNAARRVDPPPVAKVLPDPAKSFSSAAQDANALNTSRVRENATANAAREANEKLQRETAQKAQRDAAQQAKHDAKQRLLFIQQRRKAQQQTRKIQDVAHETRQSNATAFLYKNIPSQLALSKPGAAESSVLRLKQNLQGASGAVKSQTGAAIYATQQKAGVTKTLESKSFAAKNIEQINHKPPRKFLKPDENAIGPHSTFKTNAQGQVTGYMTWEKNNNRKFPYTFIEQKRVDTQYSSPHSHFDTKRNILVPTPHVHEGGKVRKATSEELPK